MKNTLITFKQALLILLLAGLFSTCSDDTSEEPKTLVGTWKLSAVYFDPGDGSGDFQATDIDKRIEFFADGRVESEDNLCFAGNSGGSASSGFYILPDSILQVDGCPEAPFPTRFSLRKESLILSYPCIEACQEKYVRAN